MSNENPGVQKFASDELNNMRTAVLAARDRINKLQISEEEEGGFINPIADAVDFVNRRIAHLQEKGQPTKAWETMAEVINDIVVFERAEVQSLFTNLSAVVTGFNTLRSALRAAGGASKAEVATLQEQLAAAHDEIENLRNQLSDAQDAAENATSTSRYRYEIPRPEASAFRMADVVTTEDVLLTSSVPGDVETRVEWIVDRDDGMVGVAVYLDHSQRPWVFPIHLFMYPWEAAHNTTFDKRNAAHVESMYTSVLNIAVGLADVLTDNFGPIAGSVFPHNHHGNEAERVFGYLSQHALGGAEARRVDAPSEEDSEGQQGDDMPSLDSEDEIAMDDEPHVPTIGDDDLDEPVGTIEGFERVDGDDPQ